MHACIHIYITTQKDLVDTFVVVEGNSTFRGDARELQLPKSLELVKDFVNRTRLVVVDLPAFGDISRDDCTERSVCNPNHLAAEVSCVV
jgi:hypothetical protein